jgi:hypothetical protein
VADADGVAEGDGLGVVLGAPDGVGAGVGVGVGVGCCVVRADFGFSVGAATVEAGRMSRYSARNAQNRTAITTVEVRMRPCHNVRGTVQGCRGGSPAASLTWAVPSSW